MAGYFAPVRRWFLSQDPKGGKAVADALEQLTAQTATAGWLPLVDGAEQPSLISDGAGGLIAVAFEP